jgi:hypothetical protein
MDTSREKRELALIQRDPCRLKKTPEQRFWEKVDKTL